MSTDSNVSGSGSVKLRTRTRRASQSVYRYGFLWTALMVVGVFCPRLSPAQELSPALVTPYELPSDTGRMVWGRKDYSSYESAVWCDRAVDHMWGEVNRTRGADTLPASFADDTVPTAVQAIARVCGGRFTVDGTPPNDLWSLLRVSLVAGDDAKSQSVIDRKLSLVRTQADSAITMTNVVFQLMNAHPARLTAAQSWLARIDAFGTSTRRAQCEARLAMLDYWKRLYNRDSLRTYANAAITLLQAMPPEERDLVNGALSPYATLIELANEAGDLAAQRALINQALTEVGGWRGGLGQQWLHTRERVLALRESLYGKRTKQLNGAYTFNTNGAPRPTPGKAALLISVKHMCGDRCFPQYTLLKQLHAEYGDALEITLIASLQGFTIDMGPIEPAEEAKRISSYFLDFLKLPAGILVDDISITKRSDGRILRRPAPSSVSAIFNGWQGANAVLIDASSTIRWIGTMNSSHDWRSVRATADRIIGRASEQPVTKTGVVSHRPRISTAFSTITDTTRTPTADTVTPPLLGSTLRYGVDTTISPCVDFYQYVNGDWRNKTKLGGTTTSPPRKIEFFHETYQQTLKRLRILLDSSQSIAATTKDPAYMVLSTFYESCLTADSLEPVPVLGSSSLSDRHDSTRAEQCVQRTITNLGGALGQVFAQRLLASDARSRMQQLLDAVRHAVVQQIKQNPWMTSDEKTVAIERLQKLQLRIGIPTQTVNYRELVLSPTKYLENTMTIANFEHQQHINAMDGDIRSQWKASLLTPNAFYNPIDHAIEVPAVMFMPPFFSVQAEDAENFAGVGYVIGHEIFHSIAGQLPQIEHQNMRTNIEKFKAVHSSLGTLDGWGTDGNRTFNEDVADLGGVLVAYQAWQLTLKARGLTPVALRDGYTPDQRFFVALGRIWRAKWRGTIFNRDVHAAPFARVNGMVMHIPEFAKAFGCKDGDPMVLPKEKRAVIW